jgi:tetratricopeptide (TPR) repeat protein
MSNSEHSNSKLILVSTITLAGSAFVAAGLIVPQVQAYAKSESTRYTVAALNGKGSEAALNYRFASLLDSHNEAAAVGLARVYLAQGRSQEALALLDRVGDNIDGLRLNVQTLTELGKYEQAKPKADKLSNSKNEGDILLGAAVYQLGGNTSELASLDSRLTSVEALQALSRLRAGDLPLALELRALGLPVSSSALLVKLPESTQRNLALSQLLLSKGDKDSLSQAANYLASGIKLDPANIELRSTFADVLQAEKQLDGASNQDKIVLRLKQGKL